MSRSLIERVAIALVGMTAAANAQASTEPTPVPAQPPAPAPAETQPPAPVPAQAPAPPPDTTPSPDPTPTPTQDTAPTTPVQDTVAPDMVTGTNQPSSNESIDLIYNDSSKAERTQAIGAQLGAAIGGRTTAGGLRVAGSYLYKLADYRESRSQDWFDGTVAFTFGSGSADCFRDRMDNVICDHGLADGYSVELSANVQRLFGQRHISNNTYFSPFVRGGLGVALVRFADDDITGVAFPLHLGAGLRVLFGDDFAITAQAEFALGIAAFNNGPGAEPQLGLNVAGGVEFRL